MFALVLVEYGVKSLDRTFTYNIPENLREKLKVGMKVVVPFGVQQINGFVIGVKDTSEESIELKEIIAITDEELILTPELLSLGEFLKSVTLCSLITAYQTMLPSSLKVKNQITNYKKYETYIELNKPEEEIFNYIETNSRKVKQIEILEAVINDHSILKSIINGSSLKSLLEAGLVKEVKSEKYRLGGGIPETINKPILSGEQENAIDKILNSMNESKTFLIHGVTGSGKTEVYLRIIEQVITSGKTAIMLVPEISLTAQMVNRFYDRFGNNVAVFHSALSNGEKYDEYLKILRGEVSIVVGTRSSIFVPLKNLGVIIIDEEHTDSYKQDNNPRYNTIDMAKFRSEYNKIPLILGSATPTLESMARALKGNYELITMNNRVGNAVLPTVSLIDMALEMRKGNMIFSDELKAKIKNRLDNNEQIILLLNRRGFSTIITCRNCGFTYKCPNCDITLTYHKTSNNLRCHYCGYFQIKDNECPECKKESLNYLGLGTEKLEQEIASEFSNARIVRMDTDTTSKKGAHAKIIEDFHNGKYDILLGTQMISKGLDFPRVSLVGVINADSTLNIPDFRSSERTFSLLNQVAGRAGRSELKGEVIIQTFNPDNYTLECVKENDYHKFYNYEMNIRKTLNYPPYYYLISLRILSNDYKTASTEATKIANFLKKNLDKNVIILGPTTANIFRVNNIYRFGIMLKYKKCENIFNVLKELDDLYISNKQVNIEIDVNPSRI